MKKSRKLLALVLAMMMAFSLMSTASAAYEEGIQPRRPSALRSHCGTMQMVIQESDWTDGYDYTYCPNDYTNLHWHSFRKKQYTFDCGHVSTVRNNEVCHWNEK